MVPLFGSNPGRVRRTKCQLTRGLSVPLFACYTGAMSKQYRPAEKPSWIVPGAEFDTPFESGCKVAEDPEWDGFGRSFTAYDSDGVLCQFSVTMPITPKEQ